MKSGNKIMTILAIIFVILTWSLVQGHILLLARHWLWAGLGILLFIFNVPTFFISKQMLCMYVYMIVATINFIGGSKFWTDPNALLYEFEIYIYCAAFSFYLTKKEKIKSKIVVSYGLAIVAITCISTMIVNYFIPGVVRQTVALVNQGQGYLADHFYAMGVCDYGFPHAIPILIPGLVLGLKKSRDFNKIIPFSLLILLILIILTVFISEVSTAIICVIIVLTLSIIGRVDTVKSNIKLLFWVSLILLLFLNKTLIVDVLSAINATLPEDSIIQHRLSEIVYSLDSGGETYGDLNERNDLYKSSIDTFLSSPIWGSNDENNIGGHAAIIDRFANLGILGGIPLLLYIYFALNHIFVSISKEYKIYFLLGIIPFLVMIFLKGMTDIYIYSYMLVLFPSIIFYIDSIRDNSFF